MFKNARIVSKGVSLGYHVETNKRGTPEFVMSSSALRSFMYCPQDWVMGREVEESKAMLFGSLVDTWLMTPNEFEDKFPVHEDTYRNEKGEIKKWNANAKACKEWLESIEEGQQAISMTEYKECLAACKRIMDDEYLNLWVMSSDKQVWLEAIWVDKATGLEIPVKVLIDFVPRLETPFQNNLGDLKCIRNAMHRAFCRQIYDRGYHIQASFYRDVYVAATKEDRNSYCFVGVQNIAPYQPFRRLLSNEFMEIGEQFYKFALARYAKCLKTGIWPGYDDDKKTIEDYSGFSLVMPEPWMAFQAESEGMEYAHDQAREESQDENAGITP